MSSREPILCGDFSLIPVPQRQAWRDAAARHLTSVARDRGDKLIPKWKEDEQLGPARLYIKLLMELGVNDLSAIVSAYTLITEQRTTYARTQ